MAIEMKSNILLLWFAFFLDAEGGKDIKMVSTVFALFGKFFIAAGFASIFLFTSELFPTIIRYASCFCNCSICMNQIVRKVFATPYFYIKPEYTVYISRSAR